MVYSEGTTTIWARPRPAGSSTWSTAAVERGEVDRLMCRRLAWLTQHAADFGDRVALVSQPM